MKTHVWRPLWVALALVAFILLLGFFLVPKDFGIQERGYMYGWHRLSNESEWKQVTVKYRGSDGCQECHEENYKEIKSSSHAAIPCENCHGPRGDHPDHPEKLSIDKDRSLCLRCHQGLPYPKNVRGQLPAIEGGKHHPGQECVSCHHPHDPQQEVKR